MKLENSSQDFWKLHSPSKDEYELLNSQNNKKKLLAFTEKYVLVQFLAKLVFPFLPPFNTQSNATNIIYHALSVCNFQY
jgi:hypothetical protein